VTRTLRLGAYYSFRWQETLIEAPFPTLTRQVAGIRLRAAVGGEVEKEEHL
jgi:hypothetical protein